MRKSCACIEALVLITIFAASGCTEQHVSPDALLLVQPGISRDEVHQKLGHVGEHEFTAAVDNVQISGEGYSFFPSGRSVYVVYRGAAVDKIVEAPPLPTRLVPFRNGSSIEVAEPVDPEARLKHVLSLPSMTQQDIEALDADVRDAQYARQRGMEPLNPATAVLAVPVMTVAAPIGAAVKSASSTRTAELGMTPDAVDALYGRPLHVSPDLTLCIYGKQSEYRGAQAETWDSLVAVVFVDGRASRVFSHDFFNPALRASTD